MDNKWPVPIWNNVKLLSLKTKVFSGWCHFKSIDIELLRKFNIQTNYFNQKLIKLNLFWCLTKCSHGHIGYCKNQGSCAKCIDFFKKPYCVYLLKSTLFLRKNRTPCLIRCSISARMKISNMHLNTSLYISAIMKSATFWGHLLFTQATLP